MLCMSWPKLSTSTGWGLISTRTSLENCSTDTCNQKKIETNKPRVTSKWQYFWRGSMPKPGSVAGAAGSHCRQQLQRSGIICSGAGP